MRRSVMDEKEISDRYGGRDHAGKDASKRQRSHGSLPQVLFGHVVLALRLDESDPSLMVIDLCSLASNQDDHALNVCACRQDYVVHVPESDDAVIVSHGLRPGRGVRLGRNSRHSRNDESRSRSCSGNLLHVSRELTKLFCRGAPKASDLSNGISLKAVCLADNSLGQGRIMDLNEVLYALGVMHKALHVARRYGVGNAGELRHQELKPVVQGDARGDKGQQLRERDERIHTYFLTASTR